MRSIVPYAYVEVIEPLVISTFAHVDAAGSGFGTVLDCDEHRVTDCPTTKIVDKCNK